MIDLIHRFPENPILKPADVTPSRGDVVVECLLNPGAFCFKGRIGLLLDLENPAKVLAMSDRPFMEPVTPYERKGFFGHVVFTNGHVLDGDNITLYYGAADSVICGRSCLPLRDSRYVVTSPL